jgi:GNAT superfamily N-acetyltransferase
VHAHARPGAETLELPQLHVNAGLVIIAESDGLICGFAVVLPRGEDEAELDGLYVEPDAQGAGVGRALADAAADFAMGALSASVLLVTADPRTVPFLHRCGFVAVGVVDTRFGPAPVLARSLGG